MKAQPETDNLKSKYENSKVKLGTLNHKHDV